MLVISRKPGERVRIGRDIWVEVVQFKNGKVRLGIHADKATVPVAREELLPVGERFQFAKEKV